MVRHFVNIVPGLYIECSCLISQELIFQLKLNYGKIVCLMKVFGERFQISVGIKLNYL